MQRVTWVQYRTEEGGWSELPHTWMSQAVIGWRERVIPGENTHNLTQKLRQWIWPWAMGYDW